MAMWFSRQGASSAASWVLTESVLFVKIPRYDAIKQSRGCIYQRALHLHLTTTGSCSALWLRLFSLSFKQPYRRKFLQTGRV